MANYRAVKTACISKDESKRAIFDHSVKVGQKLLFTPLADRFIQDSGNKEHFNGLVEKFFGAFPDATVIAKMEFSDDSKVTVELRFKEFNDAKFDLVADFLDSDMSLKARYYRLIVT
jgi:hypothetical protein